LIIAASDNEIHYDEENWLCSVADNNNIVKSWLYEEKGKILQLKKSARKLEADNLKVIF